MKKTLTILIMIILFFACSTKQPNKDEVYYVIKHPATYIKDTGNIPPPPPTIFYGNHNFILLDTSKIFYHNKHRFYICGMGIDFSKPPKLSLIPNDLTEIKMDTLLAFLSSHAQDTICEGKYVAAIISSPSDTIKNRAYKIIVDYLKSKHILCATRNWTEEEQYVATAKIENKKYEPAKVIWKVGFDTEFLPQVIK